MGKTANEAIELYHSLKRPENAECFAVEIECRVEEGLLALNERTSIATFSLGLGYADDAPV